MIPIEPAPRGGLALKLSSSSAKAQGRPRSGPKGRGASLGSFVFSGQIEVDSELATFQPQAGPWRKLLRFYLRRLKRPRASLELHFCGAQRSRGLNRKWRHKDKEGDVLSFPLQESVPEGFRGHLGSLLVDWPYVKRHAGRFAPELHEELAFLVLHGLLHLCGQHHDSLAEEAKMWRLMNSHFPPPTALLRELEKSLAHVL